MQQGPRCDHSAQRVEHKVAIVAAEHACDAASMVAEGFATRSFRRSPKHLGGFGEQSWDGEMRVGSRRCPYNLIRKEQHTLFFFKGCWMAAPLHLDQGSAKKILGTAPQTMLSSFDLFRIPAVGDHSLVRYGLVPWSHHSPRQPRTRSCGHFRFRALHPLVIRGKTLPWSSSVGRGGRQRVGVSDPVTQRWHPGMSKGVARENNTPKTCARVVT